MKVALVVARQINRDVTYNMKQIKRYMKEAKVSGADVACFGETFLQGFDSLDWNYEVDKEMAVSIDSEIMKQIYTWSKTIGIDVLFGFIERDGEKLYSSCALVSEGELHYVYRRISRGWKEYWKTDEHYVEGNTVEIFQYRGKRCVIGLCGDLWDYPERFNLGEDLLFWPVYTSFTPEDWDNGEREEYAKQAVMCCKQVLFVNPVLDGDSYGGAVVFVDGNVVAELPKGEEGMLIYEV